MYNWRGTLFQKYVHSLSNCCVIPGAPLKIPLLGINDRIFRDVQEHLLSWTKENAKACKESGQKNGKLELKASWNHMMMSFGASMMTHVLGWHVASKEDDILRLDLEEKAKVERVAIDSSLEEKVVERRQGVHTPLQMNKAGTGVIGHKISHGMAGRPILDTMALDGGLILVGTPIHLGRWIPIQEMPMQ